MFPRGLVFGPDGNLYVASAGTNEVYRYNGNTGVFIDVFASGGGLNGLWGIEFAPVPPPISVDLGAGGSSGGCFISETGQ